jgi:transposase
VYLHKLRQALRKIGEDVTETLDYVPSSFKVVRHRREKFARRGLRHGGPATGGVSSDCPRARRRVVGPYRRVEVR